MTPESHSTHTKGEETAPGQGHQLPGGGKIPPKHLHLPRYDKTSTRDVKKLAGGPEEGKGETSGKNLQN